MASIRNIGLFGGVKHSARQKEKETGNQFFWFGANLKRNLISVALDWPRGWELVRSQCPSEKSKKLPLRCLTFSGFATGGPEVVPGRRGKKQIPLSQGGRGFAVHNGLDGVGLITVNRDNYVVLVCGNSGALVDGCSQGERTELPGLSGDKLSLFARAALRALQAFCDEKRTDHPERCARFRYICAVVKNVLLDSIRSHELLRLATRKGPLRFITRRTENTPGTDMHAAAENQEEMN